MRGTACRGKGRVSEPINHAVQTGSITQTQWKSSPSTVRRLRLDNVSPSPHTQIVAVIAEKLVVISANRPSVSLKTTGTIS